MDEETQKIIKKTVTDKIGYIGDVSSITIYAKQQNTKSPAFFQVFQATAMMVAKQIQPSALKVFWVLCAKLDYSNHVGFDQQTIAEELNMPLITVKTAFRQLYKANMVTKYKGESGDARRNVYILNVNLVWKGYEKVRKKVLRDNPNQFKLLFNEDPIVLK